MKWTYLISLFQFHIFFLINIIDECRMLRESLNTERWINYFGTNTAQNMSVGERLRRFNSC
jgi:hypothetical protein